MNSSLVFIFIAFLLSFVAAAPVDISVVARDVFAPHVLTPIAGAVWEIGTKEIVTW